MLCYQDVAHNETRLLALTSLTPSEFAALVPAFEASFLERMREYTIDGLPRLNRRYTTYKNSPLPTIEDKLLFILVHMKQNLTQEAQGGLFDMIQSDANKWFQLLRPVLSQALLLATVIFILLIIIYWSLDRTLRPIMIKKGAPSSDSLSFSATTVARREGIVSRC